MLRAPLGVRIDDGRTDRHVTRHASGLSWRKTAPGGYASAQVRLDLDPATFTDLGPADKFYVYGPTGRVLFEGFIENPEDIAGTNGRATALSVLGTRVLADDQTRPFIYIDRDLGTWEPYARNAAVANATTADDPDDTIDGDGLLTGFNQGQPAAQNAIAQIGYGALIRAGMQFGAITAAVKAGKTSTDYRYELAWSPPSGSAAVVSGTQISTGVGTMTRIVGEAGHPPAGTTGIALRLKRVAVAGNITDDNTWAWWHEVAVLGRRMTRDGVHVTGAAGMQSGTYVRADWVVEDLLGRVLAGMVDQGASTVEAASYEIDQLAYPDGATMAQVLEDLTLFEPDMLWEVLEHTGAGYRFNYRAWPTEARYEVTTRDGYSAPGSEVDLCNRVAVTWTDPGGKDQITVVTAASEPGVVLPGINPTPTVFAPVLSALEENGRIRDAEPVRLPDGRGSLTNAQRLGEQVLTAAAALPKAAQVTVRRPVLDLYRGCMVMPYELEPGYPVRVRDTGEVIRCTEVDYEDDDGEATLTLGDPVLTNEQRIARLARVVKRIT